MPGSKRFFMCTCVRGALAAWLLLLLAPHGSAESARGGNAASARLSFAVVIPPVFRVLQVSPVPGGLQYRVWTNMRSAVLNGREYQFSRVGETTLLVPSQRQHLTLVHGL